MLFAEAGFGQTVRTYSTVGHKIAPVNTPELQAFYGPDFNGYNFRYRYWDGDRMRDDGLMRLDDDCHVWTYPGCL